MEEKVQLNESTIEKLEKQLSDLEISYRHQHDELASLIKEKKDRLEQEKMSKNLRTLKETLVNGGLSEKAAEEVIMRQISDALHCSSIRRL